MLAERLWRRRILFMPLYILRQARAYKGLPKAHEGRVERDERGVK